MTNLLYGYILSLVFLVACGQESTEQFATESPTADTANTPTTTTLKRRSFGYTFELSPKAKTIGLTDAAADATTFSILLTGCASTHTATVTQTKAYLEVYEFDKNCLAKLTTFSLNGKTYTPKAGNDFATWLKDDTAVFEVNGASPADELKLTVIKTISNLVLAVEEKKIEYQFSEITLGTSPTFDEADFRQSASLKVNGHASPNFKVNSVKLVSITAGGKGEFRFQLECNNTVTGTGTDIKCDDVLLSSLRLALVENIYTSDLVQADFDAIFAAETGGVGKSIDMATEAFVAGTVSPALAKGGFITANTGDSDVMVYKANTPLFGHSQMLLILYSAPSYTYFKINVTITQSGDGP